ncbi:hypothetical protein [Ferrimonas pelagia]|uniref:Uncharacterized protein n=1 Tax=Ferrimonas pelagia TaxID=1177826 RepID=A0ABP9FHL0_9GAMM
MTLSINIVDQHSSALVSMGVKKSNPSQLTIVYQTCEQYTVQGERYNNYMVVITEGLSNPVGKAPLLIFSGLAASRTPKQLVLDTQLDLLNNNYTVALALGDEIPKTICSYSQLTKGQTGASFVNKVALEAIETTGNELTVCVRYQCLDGVEPAENGDSIVVFDITGCAQAIGSERLNTERRSGVIPVTLKGVQAGALMSVGYYLGNEYGACASRQRFRLQESKA